MPLSPNTITLGERTWTEELGGGSTNIQNIAESLHLPLSIEDIIFGGERVGHKLSLRYLTINVTRKTWTVSSFRTLKAYWLLKGSTHIPAKTRKKIFSEGFTLRWKLCNILEQCPQLFPFNWHSYEPHRSVFYKAA